MNSEQRCAFWCDWLIGLLHEVVGESDLLDAASGSSWDYALPDIESSKFEDYEVFVEQWKTMVADIQATMAAGLA